VNGNGTRLERVKKKKRERKDEEKTLLEEDMPLTEGKQAQNEKENC
jgi:hypothetical protein